MLDPHGKAEVAVLPGGNHRAQKGDKNDQVLYILRGTVHAGVKYAAGHDFKHRKQGDQEQGERSENIFAEMENG
jgi:hypothetical protein